MEWFVAWHEGSREVFARGERNIKQEATRIVQLYTKCRFFAQDHIWRPIARNTWETWYKMNDGSRHMAILRRTT